ncbi:MAG: GNAT family N-acetyltransferase [Chlorobaculum sp.]|nr:GNAT family N-acetyltransferase [Chlorobaculum sp.]
MSSDVVLLTRGLRSEDEFFVLDDLYQRSFGISSVPTITQKEWWFHYPEGIIGLFLNERLIGGISYWPIDQETFIALRDGRLKERDIEARNFNAELPEYIYISDIAIEPEFRGRHYTDLLLGKFFISIKKNLVADRPLTICALGYSVAGKKILTSYGFSKVKDAENTSDKQDFYIFLASRN